ncbi:sucrase ferredoxin [Kribbella qitaiheensis]|uniref:Sucrase ferredoxin n=1 Tax=Kribbella qitaiheensis TaxID=1544730 RepID=A0A7G6X1D4_9ACTN|nr:sucrase ferredoxin [Kribbella qitaiheensis]QNE20049.1 sucrase ferredoxin [Kribbella qitaiheensis]
MTESRYQPDTGCAATAEQRGDLLMATAPPAERWLLIESRLPWPRDALSVLGASGGGLGVEVARLCREARVRPVLIRRYGRIDRTVPRRWAMVDSRPGQESVRWGELSTDEQLLDVLSGQIEGEPSTEPIYLVCTHGRHDACCAVRGRPVAAALAAAYPDRTWECSHVGGDRFAANIVLLPHSLFYGHVQQSQAVDLAKQYDEGVVVPEYYRGSGAVSAPVQAAQHFARTVGHSQAVAALRPINVRQSAPTRWQVTLAGPDSRPFLVEVAAHTVTIDARMTCAAQPPGHIRQYTLESPLPRA